MFRAKYDDDGKAFAGLFDDSHPLNDFDTQDEEVAWDMSTSFKEKDSIFTGYALVDQ